MEIYDNTIVVSSEIHLVNIEHAHTINRQHINHMSKYIEELRRNITNNVQSLTTLRNTSIKASGIRTFRKFVDTFTEKKSLRLVKEGWQTRKSHRPKVEALYDLRTRNPQGD